jgi:hypothetical protein
MLAAAEVPTMTRKQVDEALYNTVYSGRAGTLLFGPSQYFCGNVRRKEETARQLREYRRMEREYVALGGTMAPNEEQDIWSPPHHTECADQRNAEREWQIRFDAVGKQLKGMRDLLRRKKMLLAARPAP